MRIGAETPDSLNQDQQRAVHNSHRSDRVHTVRVRNPRAWCHQTQLSVVGAAAVADDSDTVAVTVISRLQRFVGRYKIALSRHLHCCYCYSRVFIGVDTASRGNVATTRFRL